MMDQTALLASEAFGQGRIVLMRLDDTVLPTLAPSQRTFAENLSRRIARDNIFDETFLRDLDAFVAFVQQLVEDGTTLCWEADEHNISGGYEIYYMDDRARTLAPAVMELRKFWTVIAKTLDAGKSAAVALQLVSE